MDVKTPQAGALMPAPEMAPRDTVLELSPDLCPHLYNGPVLPSLLGLLGEVCIPAEPSWPALGGFGAWPVLCVTPHPPRPTHTATGAPTSAPLGSGLCWAGAGQGQDAVFSRGVALPGLALGVRGASKAMEVGQVQGPDSQAGPGEAARPEAGVPLSRTQEPEQARGLLWGRLAGGGA